LQAHAYWERHHHLNVAAATTEIRCFEAHGDFNAFGADFDLDSHRVADKFSSISWGGSGNGLTIIRQIHKSARQLGASLQSCLD
jgi:hypothetical protein